jgi:hypothetical protein
MSKDGSSPVSGEGGTPHGSPNGQGGTYSINAIMGLPPQGNSPLTDHNGNTGTKRKHDENGKYKQCYTFLPGRYYIFSVLLKNIAVLSHLSILSENIQFRIFPKDLIKYLFMQYKSICICRVDIELKLPSRTLILVK